MKASGLTGRLTCAGRLVATLGPWSLQTEREQGRLTAVPVHVDEFLLENASPIMAEIDMGTIGWRWREATVQLNEGMLEITVRGRPQTWGRTDS
jgi:hypothetical protein